MRIDQICLYFLKSCKINVTKITFIHRKSRKTKQPIIPKDIEPILSSAGIDEKIAKRLLVESDKGKIIIVLSVILCIEYL